MTAKTTARCATLLIACSLIPCTLTACANTTTPTSVQATTTVAIESSFDFSVAGDGVILVKGLFPTDPSISATDALITNVEETSETTVEMRDARNTDVNGHNILRVTGKLVRDNGKTAFCAYLYKTPSTSEWFAIMPDKAHNLEYAEKQGDAIARTIAKTKKETVSDASKTETHDGATKSENGNR